MNVRPCRVVGNLGATTHGACLVYPAPAFDPAATLAPVVVEVEEEEEERCTSLYGVPAMFIAELAQPGVPVRMTTGTALLLFSLPGRCARRPGCSRVVSVPAELTSDGREDGETL